MAPSLASRLATISTRADWLAIGVLIGAPLVLLWPLWLGGRVLVWGTPLLQFGPWREAALELIRSGHGPWWTPLVGNGAPLAANLQSALFYPPNWLAFFIPVEQVLGWSAILHVIWAGFGMRLFLRSQNLSRFGSLVGALAFALSGYLISRLGFASMTSAYAWLPWMLLAVDWVMAGQKRARPMLAVVVGLQLLAGHAQTSFYSLLVVLAFAAYRFWVGPERTELGLAVRRATQIGLPLILGLGLAAIQLAPTLELTRESQRSSGVDYDFAMTYSLWPWRLLTLASPDLFGNPARGDYWAYGYYWEDDGYLGVLPLTLAFLAVIRSRQRHKQGGASLAAPTNAGAQTPFWAALALIALLLALGQNTPIYPLVFRWIPGFGLFQAPARLLSIYTVAVSVLAGIGADDWLHGQIQGSRKQRARRFGFAIAGVTGGLIAAGIASRYSLPSQTGVRLATLAGGAVWLAVLGLASLILAARRPVYESTGPDTLDLRRKRWSTIVLAVIGVDLIFAGMFLNPTAEAAVYSAGPQNEAAVREAVGQGRLFHLPQTEYDLKYKRFLLSRTFDVAGGWSAVRESWLPNLGLSLGLASANNYDSLLPGRYARLMAAIKAAPPDRALGLARLMAVGAVVSEEQPLSSLPVVVNEPGYRIYRLTDALPRAWVVPAARSAPTIEAALAAIQEATFDPRREVVLEGDAPAGSFGAGSAEVRWLVDAPD